MWAVRAMRADGAAWGGVGGARQRGEVGVVALAPLNTLFYTVQAIGNRPGIGR